MITLTIDDAPLHRRLRGLLEALGPAHLTRVLNDIGQNVIKRTKQNIAAGHDWSGAPFAANTDVTLARKRGVQPLKDSGIFVSTRLFHLPAATSVTLGAGGVQAAVLQFGARQGRFGRTRRGAPIPWGNIPPRPYFPLVGNTLHPAARTEVLTTLTEYIDEKSEG